jgi:hypothetical protein
MSRFPLLSSSEQLQLKDSLYYMKMSELRKACLKVSLPDTGKKSALLERILLFMQEGKVKKIAQIPEKSRSKNNPVHVLSPSSLMLYGSYKNDLKARNFFKQLIGSHFHFTAFGIDWLRERWLAGDPPAYQEFADFWIKEKSRREKDKPAPKDEWMFILYMQRQQKVQPEATKKELLYAWKQVQAQKKDEGFQLLEKAAYALS